MRYAGVCPCIDASKLYEMFRKERTELRTQLEQAHKREADLRARLRESYEDREQHDCQ